MTTPAFRSSGDMIADRRYAYGMECLADNDARAAADLFEQALEVAPAWTAAWFALGMALDRTGDREAAVAAFRRACVLDPADSLGASLHLVRLGAETVPDAPPAAFVRDLFDQYADRFDTALVEGLGYVAPQLIAAALHDLDGTRRYAAMLDLGCGTGLMAAAVRDRAGHVAGVDLSPRMVAAARAKGLYDELTAGDIVAAMAARPADSCDLITAADVFCYLGDLRPAIAEALRLLVPDGRLAFTVECPTEGIDPSGFGLKDSLRYGHGQGYLSAIVHELGATVRLSRPAVLRKDRGEPIAGLVVVITHS
jgi:predicted TPR repeat methyltransferase